jgi:hypothetical protein
MVGHTIFGRGFLEGIEFGPIRRVEPQPPPDALSARSIVTADSDETARQGIG